MKFELVIALMLQFVQAMRKDQSVERLALRKVPRPLNHFECNTPPLWYCNYLYLDLDSAYNNSWYSLTYNVYNY